MPLTTGIPFCGALIAENDVPGAYWLVRSMLAHGETPAVPVELLEAIAGGRWLSENTPGFIDDLHRIVRSFEPDRKSVEQALLGLAGSLRPTLLAHTVGLQNWLDAPSTAPSLGRLPAIVAEFAQPGYRS